MPRQNHRRRQASPQSSSDELIVINNEEQKVIEQQVPSYVLQNQLIPSARTARKRTREEAKYQQPISLASNRNVKRQPPPRNAPPNEESKDELQTRDQRKSLLLIKQVTSNRSSMAKMSSVQQQITCAICLNEITVATQSQLDCCNHVYCQECILQWTQKCSNQCPQCRKDIGHIIHKNLVGDEIRTPVEERRLGVIPCRCVVCEISIRERHIVINGNRPLIFNAATRCNDCAQRGIHIECMIHEVDRAFPLNWMCQACQEKEYSSDDENTPVIERILRLEIPEDILPIEFLHRRLSFQQLINASNRENRRGAIFRQSVSQAIFQQNYGDLGRLLQEFQIPREQRIRAVTEIRLQRQQQNLDVALPRNLSTIRIDRYVQSVQQLFLQNQRPQIIRQNLNSQVSPLRQLSQNFGRLGGNNARGGRGRGRGYRGRR